MKVYSKICDESFSLYSGIHFHKVKYHNTGYIFLICNMTICINKCFSNYKHTFNFNLWMSTIAYFCYFLSSNITLFRTILFGSKYVFQRKTLLFPTLGVDMCFQFALATESRLCFRFSPLYESSFSLSRVSLTR